LDFSTLDCLAPHVPIFFLLGYLRLSLSPILIFIHIAASCSWQARNSVFIMQYRIEILRVLPSIPRDSEPKKAVLVETPDDPLEVMQFLSGWLI
jgi:hypothetical protein